MPAASSTAFAKLAKVPDRAESPASPMMRSLYYPTGSSFMPLPTIGPDEQFPVGPESVPHRRPLIENTATSRAVVLLPNFSRSHGFF